MRRILVEMGALVGSPECADLVELEAAIARLRRLLAILEDDLAKAKARAKGAA